VTTKKEWLEKTYQRRMERPVRFSTLSDLEVGPLYTPPMTSPAITPPPSATPASIPAPAASTTRCIAGGSGFMKRYAGSDAKSYALFELRPHRSGADGFASAGRPRLDFNELLHAPTFPA
jgi:hypothetical protein